MKIPDISRVIRPKGKVTGTIPKIGIKIPPEKPDVLVKTAKYKPTFLDKFRNAFRIMSFDFDTIKSSFYNGAIKKIEKNKTIKLKDGTLLKVSSEGLNTTVFEIHSSPLTSNLNDMIETFYPDKKVEKVIDTIYTRPGLTGQKVTGIITDLYDAKGSRINDELVSFGNKEAASFLTDILRKVHCEL